ncbi:MAG: hypothetical protein M1838_005726 [Thelocarpon superellum]|nr:MAG: hypothetical protein M1838_005726 [Thelocarpon superellum]
MRPRRSFCEKGVAAEGQPRERRFRLGLSAVDDDDERLLATIGYRQELQRAFSKWATLSYAISIFGVLGSVPATFNNPISAGGPATAVWCWFFGSFMAMCIAMSIAELTSAYPTAGGMYFVSKHVVPAEHVPIWAWIIGWCNFLGQTAGVSSVAYTVAQMVLACASMNSSWLGDHYSYSPTPAQTVALAIFTLILMGIICSLSSGTLSKIIVWFAPINLLASVAICTALLVLTPNKQSAAWVFTTFTDGSGWGSKGFSFLLGFLAVAWTMTDYDGTTHMSEETHDAAIRGPVAIRLAVFLSGIVGWVLTITLCFCLTDLDGILASPTGLAAAQIFLNAGGRVGGTVMWVFVILVQFFTGCSAMLADTRMAFAFSRDKALPLSRLWSQVNNYTHTPVNAVWLVVLFSIVLDCIGIASNQTVVAIFNITAPALDLSYIAVILARLVYKNRVEFRPGPYTIGRWGRTINVIAICWVTFISVVLFFPTIRPVTAANMNYAICVAGFIALFSLSWWWIGARKRYRGPRTQDLIELMPDHIFNAAVYHTELGRAHL